MGLWKALFGGKNGRPNESVTAHVLNPNFGYKRMQWRAGKEISQESIDKFADNGNVFIVVVYRGGDPVSFFCKREVWLNVLRQFQAIDSESGARLKEALDLVRTFRGPEK